MKLSIKKLFIFSTVFVCGIVDAQTYAEKLGWPKGAKVIILHVDDAGMSYYSNQGAIKSIENGIATSCSIMMPCPWAASFTKHAIEKNYDAGLHLTLTSEWNDYRWPPLSGAKQVPGLVDKDWNMWPEAEDVVQHASADEVEMEIRSQLARALSMGLKPTHLDSHMGTLFASNAYLERYIKVGVENQIPVMFPGGKDQLLIECLNLPVIQKMKKEGTWKDGTVLPEPAIVKNAAAVGQQIWAAGLPVLDDLFTASGEWKPDTKGKIDPKDYGKYKAQQFIELIKRMQPGVAMFIVHSSDITDDFRFISASGESRRADMLSMLDPELKAYIQSNGIILTTWREMMERRKKVK
ncbi:MAG: polysaccharide deacetylase family protein [Chitinophagaceae bacterium]